MAKKNLFLYEIVEQHNSRISTVLRLFKFADPDTPDGKYTITAARARLLTCKPSFKIPMYPPVVNSEGDVLLSYRAISDVTEGNMSPESIEKCMKKNECFYSIYRHKADTNIVWDISDTELIARQLTVWEEYRAPLNKVNALDLNVALMEGNYERYKHNLDLIVQECRRSHDFHNPKPQPEQLELPLPEPEKEPHKRCCKTECQQEGNLLTIKIEVNSGKDVQELVDAFKDFIKRMGQS